MSHTGPGTNERQASLRRLWNVIVREFIPQPVPRLRPTDEQLTDGHLAVGTIDDAIEESPGSDVVGPDTLIISADVPGHGVLHRKVPCPLPVPGSGRRLVGQIVPFRHTTFDPDFVDDALVVGWPPEGEQRPGAVPSPESGSVACSRMEALGGLQRGGRSGRNPAVGGPVHRHRLHRW